MFNKILFFLFIFLFSLCAKKNVMKEENVEDLFQMGNNLMMEKKYDEAIKYFEKIVNEYSYTNYLIKSQFLLAECYFQKKDYHQAKLEFEFYLKTFPNGEDYETALYKLLVSELKILTSSKNLPALEELKEKFIEFKENYPNSQFFKDIKNYLKIIDSLIAKHYFDIALLYYKNSEIASAKIYFEYVKNKFSSTPYKYLSLYFLANIFYENNEKEKAEEYLKEIIKEADHELKKKAEKLLLQWKK